MHEALQLPASAAAALLPQRPAAATGGSGEGEGEGGEGGRRCSGGEGGRRCSGADEPVSCYSSESYERWAHLWQRRRRGLVKRRIEDDRTDHLRRIEELESELGRLREEGRRQPESPAAPAEDPV